MAWVYRLPCELGNMWVEYMFDFENKIPYGMLTGIKKFRMEF